MESAMEKALKDELNAVKQRIADLEERIPTEELNVRFRCPYQRGYQSVPLKTCLELAAASNKKPGTERTEWRRFELITEDEEEEEKLERLIEDKNLSRQDLATILFSLRVRPEYRRRDFGI